MRLPHKRPYMIIIVSHKPQKGAQTNQQDWTKDHNWEVHEMAHFLDYIPKKMMIQAFVIIDILNGKVIKNRPMNDDDKVFEYYMDKYKDKVQEALGRFLLMNPQMMGSEGDKQ